MKIHNKVLFTTITSITMILSTMLHASAVEVKLYGYGGITHGNGTITICPNQSQTECATLVISGDEIKIIKTATKDNQQKIDDMMKTHIIKVANTDVLNNEIVYGKDVIFVLEERK